MYRRILLILLDLLPTASAALQAQKYPRSRPSPWGVPVTCTAADLKCEHYLLWDGHKTVWIQVQSDHVQVVAERKGHVIATSNELWSIGTEKQKLQLSSCRKLPRQGDSFKVEFLAD